MDRPCHDCGDPATEEADETVVAPESSEGAGLPAVRTEAAKGEEVKTPRKRSAFWCHILHWRCWSVEDPHETLWWCVKCEAYRT